MSVFINVSMDIYGYAASAWLPWRTGMKLPSRASLLRTLGFTDEGVVSSRLSFLPKMSVQLAADDGDADAQSHTYRHADIEQVMGDVLALTRPTTTPASTATAYR
jgi:hypothetical protein